jgi:copper chaperone CopZ
MTNTPLMVETREYAVQGMTCSHCVASVREEVSDLPGVTRVDVNLASGRVAVYGASLSDDAIRTAVEQAGYEVAS